MKILRQNRLLYTVMHTAGLDLSILAALVLPALLYPICLLLAPEPRAVYGPAEPCFVRSIDLPIAPVESSVRHT